MPQENEFRVQTERFSVMLFITRLKDIVGFTMEFVSSLWTSLDRLEGFPLNASGALKYAKYLIS